MTPRTSAQQNGESVQMITLTEFRGNTRRYMDLALSGEVVEIDRLGVVYTLTKRNMETVHKSGNVATKSVQKAVNVRQETVQKADAISKSVQKVEEEVPTVNCLGNLYVPSCQEDRSVYGGKCKKDESYLCEKHGRS